MAKKPTAAAVKPRATAPVPAPPPKKEQAKVQQSELVLVNMLKAHPRNYKKHPEEQIAHLMQSIDEHGFYRNVVVARDYTILAGHGVVQAVRAMGLYGPTHVPVIRLDIDPDDPRALKIMLSDNEIGLFADVDDRRLTDMLKAVQEASSLLGTGYDKHSLMARVLASRGTGEVADENAAAQWAGLPEHDGASGTVKLVIDFESVEMRDKFVSEHAIELNSSDTTTDNVSAWWPPRARHDVASLLWKADGSER